jgi:hypothetical protein
LILPSALAYIDTSVDDAAVVRDALPIDSSQSYSVEMYLVPWEGAWHGKYQLYLRMDNSTPVYSTEGVEVELVMTGSTGAYTGTIKTYTGSVETSYALTPGTVTPQPGWLTAVVSADTVTVFWQGINIGSETVDSQAGLRVGFGLECSVDGGLNLANTFRVQYYSTGSVPALRSLLVASTDGNVFKETTYGTLTQLTTDLSLRDDTLLTAAQSGQKLYIADYGDLRVTGTDGTVSGADLDAVSVDDWSALSISADDDVVVVSNVGGATVAGTYKISSIAAGALTLASSPGDGTCSYRIERAPKVYDPVADTLTIWTATAGQVPTGCPLVAHYLDRMVLAGAEIAPHAWYMARVGTETDFDYSQTDSQAAVAGTASDAGIPGEAVVALIPHSDDYLIFGCRNSLWRLRGDPAFGGSLDSLSRVAGVVGPEAWCIGPAGEVIFLSLDGLYILPPGGENYPISVSRDVLPKELLNISPNDTVVNLEYDAQGRGVHIFLSAEDANSRLHWWFDWTGKTFWPVSLVSDHDPTSTCSAQSIPIEDYGAILGGRDGKLRRFSDLAEDDCGTAFTNYVDIGPIPLAPEGLTGALRAMNALMAAGSGDVTWNVYTGLTPEAAAGSTSSVDTGTWSEGLNAAVSPAGSGQSFVLRITGSANRKWAIENVIAETATLGLRRIP